jgi:hypothetical protein
MFIGMGMPIPDLANLPGVSRPGASTGPTVSLIENQYSMMFDAPTNTMFDLTESLSLGTSNTLCFWLKRNGASTATSNYTIFGEPSQSSYRSVYISFQAWASYLYVYTPTGSSARFDLGGYNSSTSPIQANNTNFNHYCITREGTELILYFNGIEVLPNNNNFTSSEAQKFRFIGGNYDSSASGGSEAFDGRLDEVGVFNYPLIQKAAKLIYDSSKENPGKTADLSTLSTGASTTWYRMGD